MFDEHGYRKVVIPIVLEEDFHNPRYVLPENCPAVIWNGVLSERGEEPRALKPPQ